MSPENHLSIPLHPWRVDWLRSIGAIDGELDRQLHLALARSQSRFGSLDPEIWLAPEVAAQHCTWYRDEAFTQAEHEVRILVFIQDCQNPEAAAFLRALQRMVKPPELSVEEAEEEAPEPTKDSTLAELVEHLLSQWAFYGGAICWMGRGLGEGEALRDLLETALERETRAGEDKQPSDAEDPHDSLWAQDVINRLCQPLTMEMDFGRRDDMADAMHYLSTLPPKQDVLPSADQTRATIDRELTAIAAADKAVPQAKRPHHWIEPPAAKAWQAVYRQALESQPAPEAEPPQTSPIPTTGSAPTTWPEPPAKPRWDLVPFKAVDQIAQVLTFGAIKYKDNNWREGTRWGRCYAALQRHVTAWWEGEELDPETGLSHLAHAGCCLFFLMEFQRNGWGDDDRFKGQTGAEMLKFDGVAPTPKAAA
jgi:hypothetical protein